jgi:hypothetical protein
MANARKKKQKADQNAVEPSERQSRVQKSISDAFANNLGEGISSTRPDEEQKRRKKS